MMDNTACFRGSASSERMRRFRTGLDRMLSRRWVRILFLIISGGLTGACMTFSSFPLMLAEWISLIPTCLVIFKLADDLAKKSTGRIRFRTFVRLWVYGFIFFMSEYLVVYHWFVSMYPLEFTGISKLGAAAVVLLGWVGLSILGSLAGGVVFALAVFVCSGKLCTRHPFLRIIAPALIYPLFEIFETFFWTGVPWNRLGLGQLAGNFTLTLLSSSLFGPYFVTFLLVLTSSLISHGVICGKLPRRCAAAAAVFFINAVLGLLVLLLSPGGQTVRFAAAQGNFSSSDKWSATASETLETYVKLTKEASWQGAQAVIWPETALTATVTDTNQLNQKLSDLAKEENILLSVGCFEHIGGESCNVIRTYLPDGTRAGNSYIKRHLVPFGEYVPYRDFFMTLVPPLTEISMLDSDLGEGDDPALTEFGQTSIGWLICFDSIYETLSTDTVRAGADIIMMSTNDSWFGTSRALYMHLSQARLRAIENLTPVVRSANTGISATVDRFGRIVSVSEPDTEAVVCSDLELSRGGSLYSKTGNLFILLSLAAVAAIIVTDCCLSVREASARKRNGGESDT